MNGLIRFIVFLFLFQHVSASDDGVFTIVVLPDTQWYSQQDELNHIFFNQTRWIVDNAKEMNIVWTVHLGDLVDHGRNRSEWQVASDAMGVLDDAGMGYSVVYGNHDLNKKNKNITNNFDEFFPISRIKNLGPEPNNLYEAQNTYQLANFRGVNFLMLNLAFCPTNEEISWADEVLKRYPGRYAILTTHAYMGEGGKLYTGKCGDTSYIWDGLIRGNENLLLVLCGHEMVNERRVDKNDRGDDVHQIVSNYQHFPEGGQGWLRLLRFDIDAEDITVRTYSPYLGRYLGGDENDFIVKTQLQRFESVDSEQIIEDEKPHSRGIFDILPLIVALATISVWAYLRFKT